MRIALCIPGATFTKGFVWSLSKTIPHILRAGHAVLIYTGYSADIYHGRNEIVGQSRPVNIGNGKMASAVSVLGGTAYDFMMWIDSDMVWEPEDILTLVGHNKDIVTGCAVCSTEGHIPVGHLTDDKFHNYYFNAERLGDLPLDNDGLIQVDFAGFGFICIKAGVFEKIPYPWFESHNEFVDGRWYMPTEDIGWCLTAAKSGFKIYADPAVRVGHEKRVILHPGGNK